MSLEPDNSHFSHWGSAIYQTRECHLKTNHRWILTRIIVLSIGKARYIVGQYLELTIGIVHRKPFKPTQLAQWFLSRGDRTKRYRNPLLLSIIMVTLPLITSDPEHDPVLYSSGKVYNRMVRLSHTSSSRHARCTAHTPLTQKVVKYLHQWLKINIQIWCSFYRNSRVGRGHQEFIGSGMEKMDSMILVATKRGRSLQQKASDSAQYSRRFLRARMRYIVSILSRFSPSLLHYYRPLWLAHAPHHTV